MKLAILSHNRFLYSTRRLASAAEAQGHDVHVVNPLHCRIRSTPTIGVDTKDSTLDDTEVVLARLGTTTLDTGLRILGAFEAQGIRCINSAEACSRSADKYKSMLRLSKATIPTPPSILIQQASEVDSLMENLGPPPWIFKTLKGSQGVGVVLAESLRSARSICDAFFEHHGALLAQTFIANDAQDLRAFVIGDQVVAAISRSAQGDDFRANIHRGAEASPIEVSNDIRELALSAAHTLKLDIAGVDILQNKEAPYVVDVNPSPGLEGIEEATGRDIATEIIRYACSHKD